jgi:hypothetical protein
MSSTKGDGATTPHDCNEETNKNDEKNESSLMFETPLKNNSVSKNIFFQSGKNT